MDVDAEVITDASLAELCGVSGCSLEEAQILLLQCNGNIAQALQEFMEKEAAVYQILCPYPDCRRQYEVRRSDYRCKKVRCGGNTWQDKFWQFPQHASREDVVSWLVPEWKGQRWDGWPGQVHGCGRPFSFPERADEGVKNEGLYLSWDEQTSGGIEAVLTADPEGNYSRVVAESS
eukprot:3892855-Amphidinium_carterae.1